MIEHQNFEMMSGETKILKIEAIKQDGSPLLLTGCSLQWTLQGGTQSISKSSPESITITDAAAGLFEIKLLPADTESLKNDYLHECKITDASGDVSTLFTGKAKIIKSLI